MANAGVDGMSVIGLSVAEATASPPPASVVSFAQALDNLLGGGVPCGTVTEFAGAAGMGKTQLAMQLALDVQIPTSLGGCQGAALYIDTEGGLFPERLAEMARAVEDHIGRILTKRFRASDPRVLAGLRHRCSVAALVASVIVARVTSLSSLSALMEALPAFLEKQGADADAAATAAAAAAAVAAPDAPFVPPPVSRIKLIVLDSIAFPLRCPPASWDSSQRSRFIATLGSSLHRIADNFGAAVVVTNHLVSRGGGGGGAPTAAMTAFASGGDAAADLAAALDPPDAARFVPALGDVWSHVPALRIILKWERGVRVAVLDKSLLGGGLPYTPRAQAPPPQQRQENDAMAGVPPSPVPGAYLLPPSSFVVVAAGVRGVQAARK